jgi:hypothetical protein
LKRRKSSTTLTPTTVALHLSVKATCLDSGSGQGKMIEILTVHNKCTTARHNKVWPIHKIWFLHYTIITSAQQPLTWEWAPVRVWDPPSCEGLLCSCCKSNIFSYILGPTPLCLGVVHLLCTVSTRITPLGPVSQNLPQHLMITSYHLFKI